MYITTNGVHDYEGMATMILGKGHHMIHGIVARMWIDILILRCNYEGGASNDYSDG